MSEKTKRVPFDLAQAVAEFRPGVVVKVGGGEHEPAARELARFVASELAEVRSYLGVDALPPVFISRRRDLDPTQYERGELEGNQGVEVRANFEANGWDAVHFESWLLKQVLVVSSRDRVQLESRRWVLDGFPLYWTSRKPASSAAESNSPAMLRALYGTQAGFSPSDLDHWLSFREQVGEDIADGVAWSGLRTLAQWQGPEACQKFVRSLLGVHPPKDVRAAFGSAALSWRRALNHQVSVTPNAFFSQWQSELSQARIALAESLRGLPRIQGQVEFVPLSAESRRLKFTARVQPQPKGSIPYLFLHTTLSAYDEEVDPKSLEREQQTYPEHPSDELPESYSRGTRLYWTLALNVPALGCRVISGWRRQEIP